MGLKGIKSTGNRSNKPQKSELGANQHHHSTQTQQEASGWDLRLPTAPVYECGKTEVAGGLHQSVPELVTPWHQHFTYGSRALSLSFHGQQFFGETPHCPSPSHPCLKHSRSPSPVQEVTHKSLLLYFQTI